MKFDFEVFEDFFNKACVIALILEDYTKVKGHLDKETTDLLVKRVKNLKDYVDETSSGNPTALYAVTENVGIMYYQVDPHDERSCFACLSCTPEQARQYFQTFALCCNYFSFREVYNLFNTYFNLERFYEQED